MTNIKENTTLLSWVPNTNPNVLSKMLPHKLKLEYQRPTRLDIYAMEAIIISKLATCMYNEVGAVIFHSDKQKGFRVLSSGYNGPASGDVDPREAGCARIVDGELKEGQGFCRGTHAEINALNFLDASRADNESLSMMVTLRPCFPCSKQIANFPPLKEVYYIWEYDRDPHVVEYLKRLGKTVTPYTSKYLEDWIKLNNYTPPKLLKV